MESKASTTMTWTRRIRHLNSLELVWSGGYNTYNPSVHVSSRPICISPASGSPSFTSHRAPAHRTGVVSSASFEIQFLCRHLVTYPILDVDRVSDCFGPIELGHALFLQHCPSCFHNLPILPFTYRRISTIEFV